MYTIFIEYKIQTHLKQEYLAEHARIRQQLKGLPEIVSCSWKKAVDQEHLFVESIEVKSLELYHEWKRMLKDEEKQFPWHSILHLTVEGRQKFNIWAFEAVPLHDLI